MAMNPASCLALLKRRLPHTLPRKLWADGLADTGDGCHQLALSLQVRMLLDMRPDTRLHNLNFPLYGFDHFADGGLDFSRCIAETVRLLMLHILQGFQTAHPGLHLANMQRQGLPGHGLDRLAKTGNEPCIGFVRLVAGQ